MWIYLSPHLDDAAYSCGGLLWTQTQAGEEVGVWTLFAGDPPAGRLSPFAEHMHARWGITDRSFGARRAEDDRACAMLGAEYRHYPFSTCIYRRGGRRAQNLYPTDKHMFGKLSPADSGVADELAGELIRALPPQAQLVCPLGLGNHVDHLLTRLVAERLGRPILYYEDFQRLLNYIQPDAVHVMVGGRIVRSGGPEVAIALEEQGYADWKEQEQEQGKEQEQQQEQGKEEEQQQEQKQRQTQKPASAGV